MKLKTPRARVRGVRDTQRFKMKHTTIRNNAHVRTRKGGGGRWRMQKRREASVQRKRGSAGGRDEVRKGTKGVRDEGSEEQRDEGRRRERAEREKREEWKGGRE